MIRKSAVSLIWVFLSIFCRLFSKVDLPFSNIMPKIIFYTKPWLALHHLVPKFKIYSRSWLRGWMLNLKQSDAIESIPCPSLHPNQTAMSSLNCFQLACSTYVVFRLIWSICQWSQLDIISAMTWAVPHQSVTSISRSSDDLGCFKVIQESFSEEVDNQDRMELKESNDPKLLKKNIFEHTKLDVVKKTEQKWHNFSTKCIYMYLQWKQSKSSDFSWIQKWRGHNAEGEYKLHTSKIGCS